MPKELILDNEFATLWFDSDLKAVYLFYKKTAPAEAIRDLLCRGGDILAMERAQKWLSDSRQNNRPPAEIEEWAVGTWLPQTLKAGWRFWAVVAPHSETGRAAMQHHADVYNSFGLTVRVFADLEEAEKWLASNRTIRPRKPPSGRPPFFCFATPSAIAEPVGRHSRSLEAPAPSINKKPDLVQISGYGHAVLHL